MFLWKTRHESESSSHETRGRKSYQKLSHSHCLFLGLLTLIPYTKLLGSVVYSLDRVSRAPYAKYMLRGRSDMRANVLGTRSEFVPLAELPLYNLENENTSVFNMS